MTLRPHSLRVIEAAIDEALTSLSLWPPRLAHVAGLIGARAEAARAALREGNHARALSLLSECRAHESRHSTLAERLWLAAHVALEESLDCGRAPVGAPPARSGDLICRERKKRGGRYVGLPCGEFYPAGGVCPRATLHNNNNNNNNK
jgi:hypothetical protein